MINKNSFLFNLADNNITAIIGMFIIPLLSISFTFEVMTSDTALAAIVFSVGDIIIPIFTIIGINLKEKFRIVTRIIFTVLASLVIIFNERLCLVYYPNQDDANVDLDYTNNINDYTNIEKIAGIYIMIPEYYDVRKENYYGYDIAYYPETKVAKATIGLKLMTEDVSSLQIKESKDAIVKNWQESFGNNIKIDEFYIAENYVLTMTKDEGVLSKGAIIVNEEEKKATLVVMTVDEDDKSGYDYAKDFDSMIKSAYIPINIEVEES